MDIVQQIGPLIVSTAAGFFVWLVLHLFIYSHYLPRTPMLTICKHHLVIIWVFHLFLFILLLKT